METNRLIIIVLLSTLLVGCKEYKLSQNDLEWQPYKIGDVLVFTYLGFTSTETRINSNGAVNISLEENSESLDEIVVVGYGVGCSCGCWLTCGLFVGFDVGYF